MIQETIESELGVKITILTKEQSNLDTIKANKNPFLFHFLNELDRVNSQLSDEELEKHLVVMDTFSSILIRTVGIVDEGAILIDAALAIRDEDLLSEDFDALKNMIIPVREVRMLSMDEFLDMYNNQNKQ